MPQRLGDTRSTAHPPPSPSSGMKAFGFGCRLCRTSSSRPVRPGTSCGARPHQPVPNEPVPRVPTLGAAASRGVDLDQLLDMSYEQLMQLYSARQRRRLNRGLRRKQHSLLKRLRKAKKEAPPMEKPEVVKTHLRDMIILPEMVGSMVGVYNGKTFNQVEIKPEMIGHYLGEFSITYKPVKHGRPGIGATHSSRFIPLK
uniref:40S ribosomal protein S15 n=1 Tax=Ficedula albicollis TaxID=59894 RepID=U3KHX2_FICAL